MIHVSTKQQINKSTKITVSTTRLPGIAPFLKNMTGIDPTVSPVDPDLAVGLGAAVQAGMLEGSVEKLMVFDVWQVGGC